MPVKPVWWLDDEQAAAMTDENFETLINATTDYNKEDLKSLRALRKDIEKIAPPETYE